MRTNFGPEQMSTAFGTLSAKLGGMKTGTDIGKSGLPTGRAADHLFSLEIPTNPLADGKLRDQNFAHQMVTQNLAQWPTSEPAHSKNPHVDR